MSQQYTGIYEGFTDVQVALLRAQYITDMAEDDIDQEHSARIFDLCLSAGLHPIEVDRTALVDELDWSKVEAEENSTDLGTTEADDPHPCWGG